MFYQNKLLYYKNRTNDKNWTSVRYFLITKHKKTWWYSPFNVHRRERKIFSATSQLVQLKPRVLYSLVSTIFVSFHFSYNFFLSIFILQGKKKKILSYNFFFLSTSHRHFNFIFFSSFFHFSFSFIVYHRPFQPRWIYPSQHN